MYEGLRDMLEKEVAEIERKGELDSQGLDHLYKLMTALKYTDKCIDREKGESYGRSYGRMMPWAYDDGMMRDGDNDGRYNESRDNFRDYSYRGRSNESGRRYEYSRDDSRKKMVRKLETLMDDTMSENERQAIMDCINRIQ
jgi:hypothetical protein